MEPKERRREVCSAVLSTALAVQMICRRTSRRQSDDRNTREEFCIFRHKWAIWKAIVCRLCVCVCALANLWERCNCACRGLDFFFMLVVVVVVVVCGFCLTLWNEPAHSHARAHTQTRAPFFFHSLLEDSNESSVHLWLFCAAARR